MTPQNVRDLGQASPFPALSDFWANWHPSKIRSARAPIFDRGTGCARWTSGQMDEVGKRGGLKVSEEWGFFWYPARSLDLKRVS